MHSIIGSRSCAADFARRPIVKTSVTKPALRLSCKRWAGGHGESRQRAHRPETTNLKTPPKMTTSEIIAARNEIARAAINGDTRYSHEAIGADDGDINEMTAETGLPRVHRAESDSDVAVYSDGSRHVLVADANGPIAITLRS